jgi:hypothetical protein
MTSLEGRGLAGVYVASLEFVEAGQAQAEALGFEPASVFVTHPIQDRTDAEMRQIAELALDQVLAALLE